MGGDKGQTVGDITPSDDVEETATTIKTASGVETAKTVNPTLRVLKDMELPDIDDPTFDEEVDKAVKADLDALDHLVLPSFDVDLGDEESIPEKPTLVYPRT